MKDINLPIIKKQLPEKRHLSMDDYLRFIYLNLKYTVDIKANRKLKKLSSVNTLFSLKPF